MKSDFSQKELRTTFAVSLVWLLLTALAICDHRALFCDTPMYFLNILQNADFVFHPDLPRSFDALMQAPTVILLKLFGRALPFPLALGLLEATYLLLPLMSTFFCLFILKKYSQERWMFPIFNAALFSHLMIFGFAGSYATLALSFLWPAYALTKIRKRPWFLSWLSAFLFLAAFFTYEGFLLVLAPLAFFHFRLYKKWKTSADLLLSLWALLILCFGFSYLLSVDLQREAKELLWLEGFPLWATLFFFSVLIFRPTQGLKVILLMAIAAVLMFVLPHPSRLLWDSHSAKIYLPFLMLFSVVVIEYFDFKAIPLSQLTPPLLSLGLIFAGSINEWRNHRGWSQFVGELQSLSPAQACSALDEETSLRWRQFGGMHIDKLPHMSILLQGSWQPQWVIFAPRTFSTDGDPCRWQPGLNHPFFKTDKKTIGYLTRGPRTSWSLISLDPAGLIDYSRIEKDLAQKK